MKNNQLKERIEKLSPKVKIALFSLVNDYFSLEKQNTVVVMPFFGLLHSQGNESKPILNYVDINILDIMKNQFKDVIVYPGENRYLDNYNLPLTSVEHLAHEQNTLSRIVNKTTNFNKISDKHSEILYFYKKAITNFEKIKKQYPLPYNTAFNIETPEQLINFIKQLDKKLKQENKNSKICLICPLSYLTEHSSDVYHSIQEMIKYINGTLYFAQNQSDRYLSSSDYGLLFNDQYPESFIHSIQDFSNTYCKDISTLAKNKIQFENIINNIINGNYGSTDKEIIENLDNIDIKNIYANSQNSRISTKF